MPLPAALGAVCPKENPPEAAGCDAGVAVFAPPKENPPPPLPLAAPKLNPDIVLDRKRKSWLLQMVNNNLLRMSIIKENT